MNKLWSFEKSSAQFSPLQQRLEELAREIGVDSVVITLATPTHILVQASAGQRGPLFSIGDGVYKHTTGQIAHELYCERVISEDRPLFVRDSTRNTEWSGNEDEIQFGLINYLGFPLHNPDGSMYGTVCFLHRVGRDYTEREWQALEQLRDAAEELLKRA